MGGKKSMVLHSPTTSEDVGSQFLPYDVATTILTLLVRN